MERPGPDTVPPRSDRLPKDWVYTPVPGDKRTMSFFIFWPLTLYGKTKWFEIVTVEQEYNAGGAADCVYSAWENIRFVED